MLHVLAMQMRGGGAETVSSPEEGGGGGLPCFEGGVGANSFGPMIFPLCTPPSPSLLLMTGP